MGAHTSPQPTGSAAVRQRQILYLEDNDADVRLMRESLRELEFPVQLQSFASGEAAMQFLAGEAEGTGDLPDLILLDLNVPNKNGLEVLEEIKKHPRLHRIPVIVITSSEAPRDLQQVYDLGANCVVRKPLALADIFSQSSAIAQFWFTVASLPSI